MTTFSAFCKSSIIYSPTNDDINIDFSNEQNDNKSQNEEDLIAPTAGVKEETSKNIIYSPGVRDNVGKSVISGNSKSNVIGPKNSNEPFDATEPGSGHTIVIKELGNSFGYFEDDVPVVNAWRKIDINLFPDTIDTKAFDNDYIYAYFGAGGQAIKANSGTIKIEQIENDSFAFSEYGHMLTGFFNSYGNTFTQKLEDPFELLDNANAIYYADEKTGALFTGWFRYRDSTSKYKEKEDMWLYFNKDNFRLVRASGNQFYETVIDGKSYAFDNNGVLLIGFEAFEYNLENGGPTVFKYFNENGEDIKEGFIDVIPSKYLDKSNYDDGEKVTVYISANGEIYANCMRNVNGDWYGFDDKGKVIKDNIAIFTRDGVYVDTISCEDTNAISFVKKNAYRRADGKTGTYNPSTQIIHYFDKNGKRVLNGIGIDFADERYTFVADFNGAINGYAGGHYYQNGIMLFAPDDVGYGLYIENPTKSTYKLKEAIAASIIVIDHYGNRATGQILIDKNENYWLLSPSFNLINIYSHEIKNDNGYYFKSNDYEDEDAWFPFGAKDGMRKTCVAEIIANNTNLPNGARSAYQVVPNDRIALNFTLK